MATTILQQLGKPALFMLGAHTMSFTVDALNFRVKGSKKANHIEIKLDADDTYTVTFRTIRGLKVKLVAEQSGVYVDNLHRVIEAETGLYTRL